MQEEIHLTKEQIKQAKYAFMFISLFILAVAYYFSRTIFLILLGMIVLIFMGFYYSENNEYVCTKKEKFTDTDENGNLLNYNNYKLDSLAKQNLINKEHVQYNLF